MGFQATRSMRQGDACVITVAGELDIQSKDTLIGAGQAALKDVDVTGLHLEMSSVSYIDSSGIGALVQLYNAAEASGKRFVVRNPSARLLGLLELLGLQQLLVDE